MDPVEQQYAAYNARDLERFVACYAPDVRIEDGAGNVLLEGHDAMRGLYGKLFARSPDLHARSVYRTRVGAYVLDEEIATGLSLEDHPAEVHCVAVYRVAGDRIVHVRLLW